MLVNQKSTSSFGRKVTESIINSSTSSILNLQTKELYNGYLKRFQNIDSYLRNGYGKGDKSNAKCNFGHPESLMVETSLTSEATFSALWLGSDTKNSLLGNTVG